MKAPIAPAGGEAASPLLICGVKNVSSVLYNSLKRQEPTRLSQSQSPSPLCADINIKHPHHFQKLWNVLWYFLDSHWPQTLNFTLHSVSFSAKNKNLFFSRRHLACLRGSFEVAKVLHQKHILFVL